MCINSSTNTILCIFQITQLFSFSKIKCKTNTTKYYKTMKTKYKHNSPSKKKKKLNHKQTGEHT